MGKTAVAGFEDRAARRAAARVVDRNSQAMLVEGFVFEPGATAYRDDTRACGSGPFGHAAARHALSGHGKGDLRTNGIESRWPMPGRAPGGAPSGAPS